MYASTLPNVLEILPGETDVTSSRPVGANELSWLDSRGSFGGGDSLPVIAIDCSPSAPIADDDVVLAWAVLRLRYPVLASRISYADTTPCMLCTTAATKARLVERARAHIEFGSFDNREHAMQALRAQWEGLHPERTVDVLQEMRVIWMKDAGGALGKYLFGMQVAHHQMDGRRRLALMRQFVELLSTPWVAEAELDAHFSAVPIPLQAVPISFEQLFPELDVSVLDVEEQQRGKDAFDELMKGPSTLPLSGFLYDGTMDLDKVESCSIRHVFSETTTAQFLRACKTQGVPVTHVIHAAFVVAALETSHSGLEGSRSGLVVHDDSLHFNTMLILDLEHIRMHLAKAHQKPSEPPKSTRAAPSLQIAWVPSLTSVPRARASSPAQDRAGAVWDVAWQAQANYAALTRSPFAWHILAHFVQLVYSVPIDSAPTEPWLPVLSNIGVIAQYLPPRIVGPAAWPTGSGARQPKELRIVDHMIAVKASPEGFVGHVWTFGGRMVLQCIFNGTLLSPALASKYLARAVDILTQISAPPCAEYV